MGDPEEGQVGRSSGVAAKAHVVAITYIPKKTALARPIILKGAVDYVGERACRFSSSLRFRGLSLNPDPN